MNEEFNREIMVGEYIHQPSECSKNNKNKEEILDSENIHLLIFNMSLFSI